VTYDTDRPVRRKLIGLILLCLAVRIVTPAGFMPAPIGEGGPFVLCPGGSSAASLIFAARAHGGGHHGDQHDHDSDDASRFWEFCPFGAAFGSAVIVTDVEFVLLEFEQIVPSAQPSFPHRSTTSYPFHARAPPLLTSRSV